MIHYHICLKDVHAHISTFKSTRHKLTTL